MDYTVFRVEVLHLMREKVGISRRAAETFELSVDWNKTIALYNIHCPLACCYGLKMNYS